MKFLDGIEVFGDINFRGDCPVESAEQITFFNELKRKYPHLSDVAIHPRNEGKRHYKQVQRHKAEGMNTGASDIIIPAKVSFVCEMKRKDHTKSKWENGQPEYLQAAKKLGAFTCVALGYEAAMEALEQWMSQN